jgi:hypothetical protein
VFAADHKLLRGKIIFGKRNEDLDGHHWLFARHARDVNPEGWGAKLAK